MLSFVERIFQFLIPPQCPCCKRFLGEGRPRLCSECLQEIRWIEPPFCSICGAPFLSEVVDSHPCGACLSKRRYFTMARALGFYEGPFRDVIHQWKYEGKEYLGALFAEGMAETFYRYWKSTPVDLLIPVPMHRERLRERGFNQSLLLVEELGRQTGVPHRRRVLRKRIVSAPQVELSGAEREKAVRGTFEMVKKEEVAGRSVLLVDDVYTTGATVNECARVLMAGGAERVDVLTLAHAVKTTS